MHLSGLDIFSHRWPKKDIINNCPNSYDIVVAQKFLLSIDAQHHFVISSYRRGMEKVVNWIQVNSYPMQKKLRLKTRQTNPNSPPKLIRQYQVVVYVLDHYSRPSPRRPAVPNGDYFRNVHKTPGFSVVDCWTSVKRLLKRRT